jgi:carbonic anhydrase
LIGAAERHIFLAMSSLQPSQSTNPSGDSLEIPAPSTTTNRKREALSILQRMQDGNRRFANDEMQHPHQNPGRRSELLEGQDPDVIIVSCSDSRVEPLSVFDLGLGDAFLIENAGNLVLAKGQSTSLDLASIEYMAAHFVKRERPGLLLILAHTHCGAVTETLKANGTVASPSFQLLFDSIRGNIPDAVQADPGEGLRAAVEANSSSVLDSVISNSKIVKEAVAAEMLFLVEGTYDLESGLVSFRGNLLDSAISK